MYIYDYHALQWSYINAVSGRKLTAREKDAQDYLLNHLEKLRLSESMYAKALMAVVLARNGQAQKASEYINSLKEYMVFNEEKGRYFETPRAGYSWCDYRICLLYTSPSPRDRTGHLVCRLLLEKKKK